MKKTISILFLPLLFALLATGYWLLATNSALAASVSFGNPVSSNTISGVLTNIMGYLKAVAGTIAVVFVIIGGIMYMMSMGDKDLMERGKKTLIYALAGAAIVIAAPTFLSEISKILGGSSSGISGPGLRDIAINVLRFLLSIVGILAIIFIMIGAIWMLTSGGDKERYELGRKAVTYALIGIAISVGALIIVQQVQSIVGG